MRVVLAVSAVALACSATCARAPAPRPPERTAAALPTPHLDAVPDFDSDVRPILARACEPCHVPGGRMYERLPFDDPSVVASHAEGILRRLKGDDRAALGRWIAAQPARR